MDWATGRGSAQRPVSIPAWGSVSARSAGVRLTGARLARARMTRVVGSGSRVALGRLLLGAIMSVPRPGVRRARAADGLILVLALIVIVDVVRLVLGLVVRDLVVAAALTVRLPDVAGPVLRHLHAGAARIRGVLGLVTGALDVGGSRGGGCGVAARRGRGISRAHDEHGGRYGEQRLGQGAHQFAPWWK